MSLRNLKNSWGDVGEGHSPEMQFFPLCRGSWDGPGWCKQGEGGMRAARSPISTCSWQTQACDMQIATRWPRLSVGFLHVCTQGGSGNALCLCLSDSAAVILVPWSNGLEGNAWGKVGSYCPGGNICMAYRNWSICDGCDRGINRL